VKLGRDGLIVGLGGGATTDLAGFAAATWLRGIEWKAIPTTVAGMVDAAIGGKTGINTRHGKNLVGSFYSPSGVIVDVRFLETLSTRDINAGLAEVVKCGFIADPSILSDLEKSLHVTTSLIHKAISVKAKVVSADFKESYGREVLNYGHTLGHAIEKHEKYALRHGEAVSIGMVFAAELSGLVSGLKPKIIDQHREILTSLDLPISYRAKEFDALLELVSGDKKVQKGKLRFVTLKGLGRTSRAENVPLRHLTKAYERISL
jgi:3-dehydroquinate synthase